MVQPAEGNFKGDFYADIVLPVFRATGVAWAAVKYPRQATEFTHAALAAGDAAAAAANATGTYPAVLAAANAASRATAGDALSAMAAAIKATIPVAQARLAFIAARATADALWSALSTDATRVENGAAASVIASLPLWPQRQTPDHVPWRRLKAALLAAKQEWDVWTDWYDDRLAGRVRDEARELAYVRIEEAL